MSKIVSAFLSGVWCIREQVERLLHINGLSDNGVNRRKRNGKPFLSGQSPLYCLNRFQIGNQLLHLVPVQILHDPVHHRSHAQHTLNHQQLLE